MENEEGLKILFWIGTTVMLLLGLGLLIISLIYHKKASSIKQKEAANLLKATLETEKKERDTLASDIHDGVKGDIGALKNYITILEGMANSAIEQEILNEIKLALDSTMTSIKSINYNLMPPLLQTGGFIAAVNDYFQRIEKFNSIKTSLIDDSKGFSLNTSDSYQLFRVIQEMTTNTINHNTSDSISLNISNNETGLNLEFMDNGQHFDFFKRIKESTGMGLKNIISRLNYINAKLLQEESIEGNHFIIEINSKK